MERPISRGRDDEVSDEEEEPSRAESYHSRRSLTTTGGTCSLPINPKFCRHNSSNCINVYSSYTTDPLQTANSGHDIDHNGQANVRRSASGVFRYPTGEDSENQFSDQLYLLENGCNRHGHAMPEYAMEDVYHNPKVGGDPFDGLQKQMTIMNKNLNSKLEELHGFQPIDTGVALTEIRSQLHELTKSVESCQSEVFDVKHDMLTIKSEIDSVQFVKEEIDDIRDSLFRLEADGDRRKQRLLGQGLTFFLGYSIFAAVLGMLQFGYNTGVINAPESVIEKFIRYAYRQRYNGENMTYKASTFLYAIAVAVFALGGMCGGFVGGWVANRLGRKGGLMFNNFIGVFGAVAMGCSKFLASYELLIIGRYLIGINCGLNTSLVPMYISEIAPLTLRGGLGTVNQLAVTVGLLISQVLGVEGLLGTDGGWPYLLGVALFPSLLQLCLLPMCPESPRYLLITKGQEQAARDALKKLRNSQDIEDDIMEMRAEEQAQMAEAKITLFELVTSPTLKLPLLIAIVMQLSQQLSGINAVFYYSTNLFITTGLSETSAKYATIGIGLVMVVMTLISIPLMDRSGRRTLHLYGLGGMFIFSIFITISFLVKELVAWIWWLSVVSTLFYVVFFAVGPGSIPWMITAELFSQGPRPAAMSVAVLVNWSANFFVGIGFPTMQTTLENYTFLPFSVFLALFWVFTYKKVPETKNKTFDEIATLFRIGHKQRLLMNNVNSISQMNSVVCEHSSLMGHEAKKGPMMGGGENGPDGDSKEYPLLPPNDSCPTSPRSRSPQSIRSNSQLSDYSNGHPERLMSPEDDEHSEDGSDNSERSLSTPPHPGAPHPLEQSPHAVYLRPSPFEQCNSKSPPSHQHMPPA